ncbi:MAG: FAD-dependent oxidoreductase [Planctomycetota bacterium]|jgi:kynurenine 3-monooxygenase
MSDRVLIVGAGLTGPLLACMMARRGHNVELVERRDDPRAAGYAGGRSINLALSTRGITALEHVGLAAPILADAIPMNGRMMHAVDGTLRYQAYSSNPADAINSVSRGELNKAVLDGAEKAGATLRFGARCIDADPDAPSATFENDQGETFTLAADVLLAADGAFSAVRGRMQRRERFDYSQAYLEHGYKELTIPPAEGGGFRIGRNALHIWPRGGYMMIALPNIDGSFTCTCFWPFEGPHGFAAIQREADVVPFFEQHFPDAVPHMPTLVEDFMKNPVGSLVTVRCAPWNVGSTTALVGDAAHAIVPFYGQGMNSGFEDCRVLDECLNAANDDWSKALPAYSDLRKVNGDAIADMAIANFLEMRDHVGSTGFLLKKKVGHVLHRLMPGTFVPLYNLVSFSNVPYAEARERAAAQGRLLRGICIALAFVAVILLAMIFTTLFAGPGEVPA